MKKKQKIKTIIAFSILGIVLAVCTILTILDSSADVYPNEQTKIRLYGEAHGSELYYDIEFNQWKNYYSEGYRNLFLEIPYYSAGFLNLWMNEDNDYIIDQFFEDIQGTQSGNSYYYEFLHEIKKYCPETVFYGTDVGHQNDTTGRRYLEYLEKNGFKDSVQYEKTLACIRQGEEYYADDSGHTGISAVRESYMVENFIDTYNLTGGKVMGIYGSYHTDLNNPDLMAGRLRTYYGNIISSVRTSTIAFGKVDPYQFGISITGVVFLFMLFIPNIIWANKRQPQGYDEYVKNENRVLLIFERIGEVAATCLLPVFASTDPYIKILPEGIFFEYRIILWVTALVLMIFYECYWIRYFRSKREMKDYYRSFAGFPLAGASLPVIAVLMLGLYSHNVLLITASIVLGVGHIGIHLSHYKSLKRADIVQR